MKFIKKIIFVVTILLGLNACKSFETQVLDDNDKVAVDEGQQEGSDPFTTNHGYIDDFKSFRGYWWGGAKVTPMVVGDTQVTVLSDAGNKYECWGLEFPAINMTVAPVLKIRARFEGNSVPTLGVSLKDVNGYDTNMDRPSARLKKGGYNDYYFNYTGKWKQSWPDMKTVDPKTIKDILFFVNPGKANWSGKIYIDYIKVVTVDSIPAKKARPEAATTPTEQSVETTPGGVSNTTENTPRSFPAINIDDFSGEIYSWWSGSIARIILTKDGNSLKADFDNVGPGSENFGRGFKSIDFIKTPIVKVRVKNTSTSPADLRLDLKDIDGNVTNAKPVVNKIETSPDFVDYYYDFTGKFEQSLPSKKAVNSSQILEMIFMVNAGEKAFSGSLYFNDIKAISVEDFNNKK